MRFFPVRQIMKWANLNYVRVAGCFFLFLSIFPVFVKCAEDSNMMYWSIEWSKRSFIFWYFCVKYRKWLNWCKTRSLSVVNFFWAEDSSGRLLAIRWWELMTIGKTTALESIKIPRSVAKSIHFFVYCIGLEIIYFLFWIQHENSKHYSVFRCTCMKKGSPTKTDPYAHKFIYVRGLF